MTSTPYAETMNAQRHDAAFDACDERMISPRFAQALRDNSQRQQDWLTIAEQLSDSYERGFCLRRAHAVRYGGEQNS